MATFATAKQLSAYIRKVTETHYEPLPSSIHTVLQRHGITPTTRNYNGTSVKTYDVKNAKRILTQYMYELREEDIKTNNAREFIKKNSVNPSDQQRPQYVPRKHGETNAMRELDKETLYEGKKIYITEAQFNTIIKKSLLNEISYSPRAWRSSWNIPKI